MDQIQAVFTKTMKEFIREKVILFWTVAWPVLWVLLGSFAFTRETPPEFMPLAKGAITLPMIIFSLMIAGMANIPSNIGEDRQRGLLSKLRSMPIPPWKDFTGRFLALLAFSGIAAVIVSAVGYAVGARVEGSLTDWVVSGTLLAIAVVASAGIGMLIGSLVRNVQGATMTGIGIAVVSSFISGVMLPYRFLPEALQVFSRVYPPSSVNAMVMYLLVGEETLGYNPLTLLQVGVTVVVSVALFAAGLTAYSTYAWREE